MTRLEQIAERLVEDLALIAQDPLNVGEEYHARLDDLAYLLRYIERLRAEMKEASGEPHFGTWYLTKMAELDREE